MIEKLSISQKNCRYNLSHKLAKMVSRFGTIIYKPAWAAVGDFLLGVEAELQADEYTIDVACVDHIDQDADSVGGVI